MGKIKRAALVGNGWVLAGAVLYLLELVAIIGGGLAGVGTQGVRGAPLTEVMASYTGHADALYASAGWFAVVLLGRILFFIGLRRALADSGYSHPLLDFAVAASVVSVTLEIASFGLAASAVAPADAGDTSLAMLVDQAGAGLNLVLGGGLGVAIVSATYVMWRSRLFGVTLNVLGAVSGIGIILAQLSIAPTLQPVFEVLSYFPFVFWVWIIWTGVVCMRGRTTRSIDPLPSAEAVA